MIVIRSTERSTPRDHRRSATCGRILAVALTAALTGTSAALPSTIAAAPAAHAATPSAASAPKTPAPDYFVERITTAPHPVTDRAGRVWKARPATLGTRNLGGRLAASDVRLTTEDALYRSNAWGTPGYTLPVPATGTYQVRLLMAEDTFTEAGRRVFTVSSEGRVVQRDVDIARAVGRGAAYDLTFSTLVTDGQLDLAFTAVRDQPLVSSIEVTSTQKLPQSVLTAPAASAVTLPQGSIWLGDVSKAPTAANSAGVAAALASQVRNHWGGTAAVNAFAFNVGFARATPATKRVTVGFHDCQRKRTVPAGLYDGAKHFVDVPVPDDAVPAAGSDGQLTVYDPAGDRLWEFWQMRRKAGTRMWEACWGGRLDGVSKDVRGAFPYPYGASASGLAIAPGMITVDEVRRGRITHAMVLNVLDVGSWRKVSWPANRSDGISNRADALLEGQRVRLDPRLDLSRYRLSPFARMVAEAAQRYGFIVTDRSGAVAVVTQSGAAEAARTKADPWHRLLGGPAYNALDGFPWEHIQVLPVDYGRR